MSSTDPKSQNVYTLDQVRTRATCMQVSMATKIDVVCVLADIVCLCVFACEMRRCFPAFSQEIVTDTWHFPYSASYMYQGG